jgi:predicted SprT family Zn-dependent metalloprotease
MDLQALFDGQNRELFGGRLPRCVVRWSPRLKVAGQIVREEGLIRLGLEYHCHYPADVLSTLRHEMVHLVHWDHDAAFRGECLRVGAAVRCRTYPGIFRPWRYLYQCPTCGARRAVRRKIRAACRGCGRGARRDAARARLRLVEYLA